MLNFGVWLQRYILLGSCSVYTGSCQHTEQWAT